MAWADDVIDPLGHDPRDNYCEQFWLPLAGPSALLLGRRLAAWLEEQPDGLTVPLVPLSGALGLGHGVSRTSPLVRAFGRLVGFGLARIEPAGATLAARRRWPEPEPCAYPPGWPPNTKPPFAPPQTPPGQPGCTPSTDLTPRHGPAGRQPSTGRADDQREDHE